VESIFNDVLAGPEAAWEAAIAGRCGGEAPLEAEVRSLLQAFQAQQRLTLPGAGPDHREAAPAFEGRWIGPYQVDRFLARGGMGAVYLAHRGDGHFQQQVAIKLIDLPLATDLFRERFRQERQILAGLVHPFIARLLDGGVSDDGDLYLAMEFVDGTGIDRHCRERRLTLRQRLELFTKVCAAVAFAHQNLVVHRDLKPDNILVQADGTPKLLDFGTAKLLGPAPAAGPDSAFTRLGFQSFTPGYASPEQVLGETITTASDIYSLGVLLYLLLAGVPPYEIREGSTAELIRLVCTETPPRPGQVSAGPERPDADLDAIVLKAMRKAPQDRYRSVDDFAADIQAYLAGRPVRARRGTLRYRAGKFVGRNKLALAALALVFVSVNAGLAGVLWQFRRAGLEGRKAEARAEDMRQLSRSLLSEIDEAVKQLPGSTPVRKLLVARVLEHLDHMARDMARDRRTQLDLVDAYTRLGNLQGNRYEQNVGDSEGALVSLTKAVTLGRELRAATPGDPAVLGALAWAERSRSEVLWGDARVQESVGVMREALADYEGLLAHTAPTALQFAEVSTTYASLGDQLGQGGGPNLGDAGGALEAYRKAIECAMRALKVDPGFTRSKLALATNHLKIATILTDTDPGPAIEEFHQSLAILEALPEADRATANVRRVQASTTRRLAMALTETRQYGPSLAAFKEAREPLERLAAVDAGDTRAANDLWVVLSNEALTYIDLVDPQLNPPSAHAKEDMARGIELMDRSIAILRRLVALSPGNQALVTPMSYNMVLAGTLKERLHGPGSGQDQTAAGLEALCRAAQAPDADSQTLDCAAAALLNVLPRRLRDPQQAIGFADRLVARTQRRKPLYLLTLAQARHAAGHLEQARATAREALALLPPLRPGATRSRLRVYLEAEREGARRG